MATAEITPARVVRKAAVTFLGLTVLIGCLTVLFLGMRAVMEIGGSCGSGGPYEIAHPCPEGVGWMMPVSIWVGLAALGLYIGGDSGLPGPQWWPLAWPALFLSLGWNFWEYGLDPPGQSTTEWGWVVCGMLFVLMGGLPLVALLWSPDARRGLLWADADEEPERTTVRTVARSAAPTLTRSEGAVKQGAVVSSGAMTATEEPQPLVDDLERLAQLYRNSELTVDEYQAAKARLLGEDTP